MVLKRAKKVSAKRQVGFIKLKISKNKAQATIINNKRYTLNDANELIIKKEAEQKIGKNNAIKSYNNLINKAEQIAELRPTEPRQKNVENI